MSIILDPKRPMSFKPRDDGPTYFLRPPRVADRNAYKHAVRSKGGQIWRNLDLMRIVREGLDELLPGEAGNDGRALVEGYTANLQAAIDAWLAEKTDETRTALTAALEYPKDLVKIMELLRRQHEPLASALADNSVYYGIAGQAAARLFLVGWEGLGPFKRDLGGPTEETLAQIPSGDFERIALEIESMLEPSEERIKNSDSPSSSPPKGNGSSSDGMSIPPTSPSPERDATAIV
jgi:hypothetical protein